MFCTINFSKRSQYATDRSRIARLRTRSLLVVTMCVTNDNLVILWSLLTIRIQQQRSECCKECCNGLLAVYKLEGRYNCYHTSVNTSFHIMYCAQVSLFKHKRWESNIRYFFIILYFTDINFEVVFNHFFFFLQF